MEKPEETQERFAVKKIKRPEPPKDDPPKKIKVKLVNLKSLQSTSFLQQLRINNLKERKNSDSGPALSDNRRSGPPSVTDKLPASYQ